MYHHYYCVLYDQRTSPSTRISPAQKKGFRSNEENRRQFSKFPFTTTTERLVQTSYSIQERRCHYPLRYTTISSTRFGIVRILNVPIPRPSVSLRSLAEPGTRSLDNISFESSFWNLGTPCNDSLYITTETRDTRLHDLHRSYTWLIPQTSICHHSLYHEV